MATMDLASQNPCVPPVMLSSTLGEFCLLNGQSISILSSDWSYNAFHYASALEQEIQLATEDQAAESDDDCDSGNDEPSDYFPLERRASVSVTPAEQGQVSLLIGQFV